MTKTSLICRTIATIAVVIGLSSVMVKLEPSIGPIVALCVTLIACVGAIWGTAGIRGASNKKG